MAIFNFNFNIKEKPKNIKSEKHKILEENIEGVVNVELNGTFYITDLENNRFEIYPKNYNCKGISKVYPLLIDNKTNSRICYIRNENKQELIHKAYLPFAPGLCVKGNIIEEYGSKYFNIKEIFINNGIENARNAFKFYKENYKEIIKNIKSK